MWNIPTKRLIYKLNKVRFLKKQITYNTLNITVSTTNRFKIQFLKH